MADWSSTGSTTYYAAYERVYITYEPTYECSNTNDLYQTKIGLITADEVMYAGGTGYNYNYGYYLYTGNAYWTMSPLNFNRGDASMFYVDWGGDLSRILVYSAYGVRPVINLSADVTITGGGTISDPYIVN